MLTLAGLVGSTAALAADLPPRPPTEPVVVQTFYNWTGFYIGGNAGGMRTSGDLTDLITGTTVSFGNSHSGFIAGGQIGYNWQFGNFVVGVEWDGDWSNLSGNGRTAVAPPLGTFVGFAGTDWLTTIAGRFGVAADRWLFYGKAGYGWVDNKVTITNTGTGASWSATNSNGGWLVGAGVEYAFSQNWTAKLEFDYIGLSSWNTTSTLFPVVDRVSLSRNVELLKFGVNYKF